MIGKIKNIKLQYTNEGAYWLITIVDQNDYEIGTFGTSDKDDAINFRMQTFGLMKILNKMNLFDLGNLSLKFPILVKRSAVFIESIANAHGYFFAVDKEANMNFGKTDDLTEYETANITKFESGSGVLALKIENDYSMQYFQFPNVYLGFKPLYNFNIDKKFELDGANRFMYTVCSVLKLCNITDLLPQNDTIIDYPQIYYVLDDNGQIQSIGNLEQNCWLNNEIDEYTLTNVLPEKKSIYKK